MQLAFYTSSRHEAKFEISKKATHVRAAFTRGFPAAGNEVDESGERELNKHLSCEHLNQNNALKDTKMLWAPSVRPLSSYTY